MKNIWFTHYFGMLLIIIGFALLWHSYSFTLPAGIFLMLWGNNLEQKK